MLMENVDIYRRQDSEYTFLKKANTERLLSDAFTQIARLKMMNRKTGHNSTYNQYSLEKRHEILYELDEEYKEKYGKLFLYRLSNFGPFKFYLLYF